MAKDTCIICGKESPYDFETHIDLRVGYVEGAGQLCSLCHNEATNRNHISIPEYLIENTPNDFELGGKVREAYWRNKK